MNVEKDLTKLEKFQARNWRFFKNYLKHSVPTLISALIIGYILRYILLVRGIEYVIIAGIIIIAVKRGR